MVVLVDVNVVLDYILKREPFYESARNIVSILSEGLAEGCIALHTVTTIWYILRKIPEDTRRNILKSICQLFKIVSTTHEEVLNAVEMTDFKDFEDCIQSKCAKTAEADYIITRNISDFSVSEVNTITPEEFCRLFNK